jgi:hypothetical protein
VREHRLVDLHDQPFDAGQPTAYVAHVVAQSLGQGLAELAAGAVVAEHLVAARLLDGRGQGPRSDHLDLEAAGVAVGVLLEAVEVLREEAAGPAVVDPGGVREPPAGRLEVRTQRRHHREAAAGHPGGHPTARHLGQVRQVGQLLEHEADGLVEGRLVVAGHRPDAGRKRHPETRSVAAIVADPTTRVPS